MRLCRGFVVYEVSWLPVPPTSGTLGAKSGNGNEAEDAANVTVLRQHDSYHNRRTQA